MANITINQKYIVKTEDDDAVDCLHGEANTHSCFCFSSLVFSQ